LRVCVRGYTCVAWFSDAGECGGRVGVRDVVAESVAEESVFVFEVV